VGLDGAALARDFAEGIMLADAQAPTWGPIDLGLGHTLRFRPWLWSWLSWLVHMQQHMEVSKLVCPIQTLRARSVTFLFHQGVAGHGRLK
jgi:hypothetical protein